MLKVNLQMWISHWEDHPLPIGHPLVVEGASNCSQILSVRTWAINVYLGALICVNMFPKVLCNLFDSLSGRFLQTWTKNTFELDVAKGAMPVLYFHLDYLMGHDSDLLSAWYTLRVN